MAQFKRFETPTLDSELNQALPDLVLGDRTEAVIGGRHTLSSYYLNFKISDAPEFGSGDIESLELQTNIGSITYGTNEKIPKLNAYLLYKEASTEGAAKNAAADDATVDPNYLVYSYTPDSYQTTLAETFSDISLVDRASIVLPDFVREEHTEPYVPYTRIHSGDIEVLNYTVDEVKKYGERVNTENGDFLGYKVELTPNWNDPAYKGTGRTVGEMSGYANYSHGYYIVCREDKAAYGGSHPPRGKMWLSRTYSSEVDIVYHRVKTNNVDTTQLKPAGAGDTTIFNRFESTPELILVPSAVDGSGGSGAAATGDLIANSDLDRVESFVSTIELDSANVSTGGNSLKIRNYAKPYANHVFVLKDGLGLSNRQYLRMDALDMPAPVYYDATASGASSVQGQIMKIRTSIEKMAPAFKSFIGVPDSDFAARVGAITAHDSSTNGLVTVDIAMDGSGGDFTDTENFFMDRNQNLIGTRCSVADSNDGTVQTFTVMGYGSYNSGTRRHSILLKRVAHDKNPDTNVLISFHKTGTTNENIGQITNQRGLFFNLTTEDINKGLSHTSAMSLHGRRQNNTSHPTGYTVPDSAYDFGIVKDEDLEDNLLDSSAARYTFVHNGRLFEHGGKITDGGATSNSGIGELMVDYGPKSGVYNTTTTGTGYDTLVANATGGATATTSNNLAIQEGEFFDIILVMSPHSSDIKVYIQDLEGNSLFTSSSTKFATINNVNATNTSGFKDPTDSAGKWPMNMYIYVNNTKDQRTTDSKFTSHESDYWKAFVNQDAATNVESIVNIDSVVLEHWKPVTGNNTLHINNTSKTPISFAHTALLDYADTGDYNRNITFNPKSYVAIGHKTAASVSGDNSQLSLLFAGFNRPLAGLDNTQSLTKITTSTFGATTTEKQGHQGTYEFFDTSSGTGYAASSFDIDGHALGPDGFTCKGAAVLKWNDSPRTHTKRECIFASTRVTRIIDEKTVVVDNPDMLRVDFGESTDWSQTFIIYKYGEDFDDTNHKQGLKIESIHGNIVKFTTSVLKDDGDSNEFNTDNLFNVYISPEAFWIVVGFDVDGKESRSYSGIARVPSHTSNDVPDYTLGVTFNEFLYNDGANTNAWNLIVAEDTNVNVAHDYGFGTFKDDQTGFASTLWANAGANNFKFDKSVISQNKNKLGDTIPMLIQPNTFTDAIISLDTKDNATVADRPRCVTIFEDELPTVSSFKVSPNESDPFNLDFTWECSDEDIWYGFISIDSKSIENQYTNALLHFPLNEAGVHGNSAFSTEPIENISGASTEANGILFDLEGLAGNAVRFDGTNDYVRTASGQAALGDLTEASFVIHTVHDTAAISGTQHILFKDECVEISANSSSQIVCDLYWDANSFVRLTSTSLIIRDGATPQNIIVTLDTTLKSGNAKLFIDGRLEDQSGLVISADATGEQTGWLKDATLENNSNRLFIGNNATSSSNGWVGKIEEVVVYSKALYPVKPSDGKFTLTKPLKELHSTQSSSSLAYTARIFVKDYHNIRGKSRQEVASSPAISFRKAAFLLNNS